MEKCGRCSQSGSVQNGDDIGALRRELEKLRRENEELRSVSVPATSSAGGFSIEGADEFHLRLSSGGAAANTILHANSALLRYLGVARREDFVGEKVEVLRRYLSSEMYRAIALPADGESLVNMAADKQGRAFRVQTTRKGDLLDVVMRDVTAEHGFKELVKRYVMKDFENLSEDDLRTFRFPERRFMTISFTDLRGFTALTETLPPEEVRDMVNAYFECIIHAIESNEATVVQLVGDEVMAFYGAPRSLKDHALRAIKTACEQIEAMRDLCDSYARRGKIMCRCGIGINAGEVVLGNMGSAGRQAYTALGPAVNFASRLCGAARPDEILLTVSVLHAALEALPDGWEVVEGFSLDSGEDFGDMGGKVEGVRALPDELRGKIISIGPGVRTKKKPPEYVFRYLCLLKAKGVALEVPVLSVERSAHARAKMPLSEEPASAARSTIMLGKYQLLEKIGEGGMGKVWKGRDSFGNYVAIKLLKSGFAASEQQLARFTGEAEIMAKLPHRNICHIHEISEAEGERFIAMEYVEGITLADLISHGSDNSAIVSGSHVSRGSAITEVIAQIQEEKKQPRKESELAPNIMLPMKEALGIMRTVCEAVCFVHERGILHRDLKPGNIMIRPDGDPVVMDFGLAKLDSGQSLSIDGQVIGSIEYMAPEQAMGSKHVDERADVYSLGAIFYELLTGRKHFVSPGSLAAAVQALQTHEPVAPRKLNPALDKELEFILVKALRPDPAERIDSVKTLLECVRRYEAGDPLPIRPANYFYRLRKKARKHRVALSWSAALLTLSLVFGGWYYQEWRKQWGDWTKVFSRDFDKAPKDSNELEKMLGESFAFLDKGAKSPTPPWTVRDGGLVMRKHQWLWLRGVNVRTDVKVVVKLRVRGNADAFQICLNSKTLLRQWEHNPAGYSCRVGIWSGSTDTISRQSVDARDNFDDFLVSRSQESFTASPENPKTITITFQRQGDVAELDVDGKGRHQRRFLTPLVGADTGEHKFSNVGLRTWSEDGVVEILSVNVYRYKLPEQANPGVAGDALAEAGYTRGAIEQYQDVAADYAGQSSDITIPALAKAYVLAVNSEEPQAGEAALKKLQEIVSKRGIGKASAVYWEMVREAQARHLWNKDGDDRRQQALGIVREILQADPASRVAVECLQEERSWPHSPMRNALLAEIPRTQNLAGLNVRNLGLESLQPLAALTSLRCLDCEDNAIAELTALEGMRDMKALYCGRNRLQSLAPLTGVGLFSLQCQRNTIRSLAPLAGMPLYELNCGGNEIELLDPLPAISTLGSLDISDNKVTSLLPLANLRLYYLDCSGNPLVSLEPFVENPPATFLFLTPSLPVAEVERAVTAWENKPELKYHTLYARVALAVLKDQIPAIKSLARSSDGHNYLFMQQPMTYSEAEAFAIKAGGKLLEIESVEENEAIREFVPRDAACWLGKSAAPVIAGQGVQPAIAPVKFAPEWTDFGGEKTRMTWKNGHWFPQDPERRISFVIEWE